VIGTLHAGFQFGWNVHTLAYALMMLVIISGIYGVSAYATLPNELSDNRAEMTKGQMVDAVYKIDRQLQLAAQPLAWRGYRIGRQLHRPEPVQGRPVSRLSGRYAKCPNRRALTEMRRRLATATGEQADALETVVNLLERKAAALGRIRKHMKIKALLEVWLFVHVPVTFALIAALAAHIVSVFFYW
jgi:hypothetical protein